jgi:hypothetical protein
VIQRVSSWGCSTGQASEHGHRYLKEQKILHRFHVSFCGGIALLRSGGRQKSWFYRGRKETGKMRAGFSLTRIGFALAEPDRSQRSFTEAPGGGCSR